MGGFRRRLTENSHSIFYWCLFSRKILSFSFTVSSGGSGGIFAPCLFVGAMLGGFMADMLGQPCAPFVVIGLVAVFGAAARVPFATLLMVAEMTGGYQLLVPAATALSVSLRHSDDVDQASDL